MDNKPCAVIIDHVGNVDERHGGHGLPDKAKVLTLDRRRRKQTQGVIQTTTCPECMETYERIEPKCPSCGYKPEPQTRSNPAHVAGDLVELDAATLEAMRQAEAAVDMTEQEYVASQTDKGFPYPWAAANGKRHRAIQLAQTELRSVMDWWAGVESNRGRDLPACYRAFYLAFGVDASTARTLNAKDAASLRNRILATLPEPVKAIA